MMMIVNTLSSNGNVIEFVGGKQDDSVYSIDQVVHLENGVQTKLYIVQELLAEIIHAYNPVKSDDDDEADAGKSRFVAKSTKAVGDGKKKSSCLKRDDDMALSKTGTFDTGGLQVDYYDDDDATMSDNDPAPENLLPFTQAQSDFMQQSSTESGDEAAITAKAKVDKAKGGKKGRKSVTLNTEKNQSKARAQEEGGNKSAGITNLQMSTRGIHEMDPDVLAAHLQSQAQTQYSSTISPETKASMMAEESLATAGGGGGSGKEEESKKEDDSSDNDAAFDGDDEHISQERETISDVEMAELRNMVSKQNELFAKATKILAEATKIGKAQAALLGAQGN